MPEPVTGADLVRQARRYLNVPFQPGGRNRFGLDCGGLLLRVAEDLGLPVPTIPNYQLSVGTAHVSGYLEPLCDRVDLTAPLSIYQGCGVKPGDFLVFSLAKGVQHLGIASGTGTFIHAYDSPSVHRVVEMPLDGWWQARLLSIWRLRELAATP